MPPTEIPRILVIKLSSLGDFIMALGAFRAIRDHHGGSEITLLTTAAYGDLARRCGLFDHVWIDQRPPLTRPDLWLALAWRFRRGGFDRVYDLQWTDRSGWYYRLFGPSKPEWVGIVRGCSHRYLEPRKAVHKMQRHCEMLALAGISQVPGPDLSFLETGLDRFELAGPYALLVPGSSPSRIASRWPVAHFIAVAEALVARGLTPVLVYGRQERDVVVAIKSACPQVCDLEPSLGEIVSLARGAALAVANDTGPMHLIVHADCPTIVLLSGQYPLAVAEPPGATVALQRESVADIAVSEVLDAVGRCLDGPSDS